MAVRTPTPATAAAPSPETDQLAGDPLAVNSLAVDHLAAGPAEGRAERWASWVVIYLAALLSSLALGASAWALGLTG